MAYLDTSFLIAALTEEASTTRVQRLLADIGPAALISDWTLTEVSSALSLKLRSGLVSAERRAISLSAFKRFAAESFEVLPVTASHFRVAARFADRDDTNLRSGDALHLAVAADTGTTVWTLDRQMANAGPLVGVPTRLV